MSIMEKKYQQIFNIHVGTRKRIAHNLWISLILHVLLICVSV
jgi:hypothetical protein